MDETNAPPVSDAERIVDEQIASLLAKIEQESVPHRLLELARQLQKALNARKR